MTKQEHREKLYRLYLNFKCEEMADCRDWDAFSAADHAYRQQQKNYSLQWGEEWTWLDAEAMWSEQSRRVMVDT